MHAYGAFLLYLRAATVNRLRLAAGRMRQPRYLAGFLLVALYFWFFFFQHLTGTALMMGSAEEGRLTARWSLTVFLLLQVVLVWIVGPFSKRGLQWRPSDRALLFAAPIRRADLLAFKWLEAQIGMSFGSAFFGFILARFDGVSFPVAALGWLAAGNVMFLHGLLARLLIARWRLLPGAGRALIAVPGLLLVGGLVMAFVLSLRAVGPIAGLADMARLVEEPYLALYLKPLALLAEPVTALGLAGFARAMWAPAAAMGVLWIAVVLADRDLEAARHASECEALARGDLRPRSASEEETPSVVDRDTRLPLAETGPAWRAILWKNLVVLGRLHKRIWWIEGTIVVGFLVFGLVYGRAHATDGKWLVMTIVAFLPYVTIIGMMSLRNDLRIDLPHFDLLRSMPIRGRGLILGEVLGPTVALLGLQTGILCAAGLLLETGPEGQIIPVWLRLELVVGGILVFAAFDLLVVTSENMIALYLPSFISFGRHRKPGLEQMGQRLLGAIVRGLGMFALLVAPTIVATVVVVPLALLGGKAWIPISAAIAASAAMFAEVGGLVLLAERRYETFDLSDEVLEQN